MGRDAWRFGAGRARESRKCASCERAGGCGRWRNMVLGGAGESGHGMSCEDGEAAAGGGLLVGRGWFERAIERAPGDVATSVATGSPTSRDLELRSQPSSEVPIAHGVFASFLKPYGQRSVFLGKAWPKANVVVPPS